MNIMEAKDKAFESVYRRLYQVGTRGLPAVVQNQDGNRQDARWDSSVQETDKRYLGTAHFNQKFLFTILVCLMTQPQVSSTVRERRVTAAVILRDLVNRIVSQGEQLFVAIPFGSRNGAMIGLPVQNGRFRSAKEALLQLEGGPQFIEWWNAVIADDVKLTRTLLVNPEFRILLMLNFHWFSSFLVGSQNDCCPPL